jgi:serine/threonine-protein kinase
MVLSRADRVEHPLLRTPASETNAALSPDGRFMAYQSDESGRFEIHVRTFPDVDKGHWVISAGGGEDPRWARSGKVLYYRSGRRIMMANVRTSPVFEAEPARVRLESRLTLPSDPRVDAILRRRTYDVTDNDARMLMLEDVAAVDDVSVRSAIVVVQNWVEQLRNPAAPRK